MTVVYMPSDECPNSLNSALSAGCSSLRWQAPASSSQYYSLSAQDSGQGALKCRILVDGTVVSERTVGAPNGFVRCSKTVG